MRTARRTARDLERVAAAARPRRVVPTAAPSNEALAMLVRRGLRPRATRLDLPFPASLDEPVAQRLVSLLDHYAFRLFMRGAILQREGFRPSDATAYVTGAQARSFADALADIGLASWTSDSRVELASTASSFGGTLEWYIARELRRRLGFDVAAGVKFHSSGVGGDLDVVAAAEGRLVYLEVKSSPPKHLSDSEVVAFFNRLDRVRPDVALFVMDTALRLGDKVVPMLAGGFLQTAGGPPATPRRIERELWALTPHLYVVNSKPDLLGNIGRAIAEGLRALAPPLSRRHQASESPADATVTR